MRRRLLALPVALVALLAPASPAAAGAAEPLPGACPSPHPGYDPAPVAGGETVLADQLVTMSDGTQLALDVHLPAGLDGPFPTVLSITGYGKSGPIPNDQGELTSHGYASVVVDDRGTGASGGQWDAWGARTQADYAEVLDWVAAQRWSDGSVAVTGTSYGAITSLFAAASGHPSVRAVFAVVPMGDGYRDITFAGGQVNAAFVPAWMGLVTALGILNTTSNPAALVDHLLGAPAFQAPTLLEAAAGGDAAFDGPFWRQRSPLEVIDGVAAPTFVVGGLDDLFQRGEPMLYEALADHTDARLLVGPWTHTDVGSGLEAHGLPSLASLRLSWFDHHVRGVDTGAGCIPPVTQFLRGVDTYRTASSWPVEDLAPVRWHLRGDGGLTTEAPDDGEPGRQYLQLPVTGACTRSANQWLIGVASPTPCATDNRLDESLPGSLTYTSEPFEAATELNGPIQADLWLVPSTPEAIVAVAVSDVAPDGTSRGLTNGLLAASHRAVDPARSRLLDGESIQPWHPFGRADVLAVTPGEPVLVPVEVFPTSAVLQPGHRLRVTVAAYDVPHALPPLPAALRTLGGPVTVRSDAGHPSSLVVPVVSPDEGPDHDDAATPADPAPAPTAAAVGGVAPAGGAAAPAGPTTTTAAEPATQTVGSTSALRVGNGTAAAALAAVVAAAGVLARRRAVARCAG